MDLVLVGEAMCRIVANGGMPETTRLHFQLDGKCNDLILDLLVFMTDPAIGLQCVKESRSANRHSRSLPENRFVFINLLLELLATAVEGDFRDVV